MLHTIISQPKCLVSIYVSLTVDVGMQRFDAVNDLSALKRYYRLFDLLTDTVNEQGTARRLFIANRFRRVRR